MIRCMHYKDDIYNKRNYHCIPYVKRYGKGEKNTVIPEHKNHPCPFKNFLECKEWMDTEKINLLWKIWLEKYDPGGLNASKFHEWLGHIKHIEPECVFDFYRRNIKRLEFKGYPPEKCSDDEKLYHELELLSFSPNDREDDDVCLNDYCSTWCKKFIICPMVHYKKELLNIGIPSNIGKTRSYNRWKWHLNNAEDKIKNNDKQGELYKARIIWFILRQIAKKDFSIVASRKSFNLDLKNQTRLIEK